MLIAALSSAQKAGIAGMGAAFIVFALISSFVIPRYRPDFPGRWLRSYVAAVIVFFASMMVVVVLVGREKSEAKIAQTAPVTTAPDKTTPTPPIKGDPAAGKQVFAAQGCGACHTFAPAGAAAVGTIGPNLAHLAGDAAKANRGSLDQYTLESIKDPNAYVVPGFAKGVMPTNFGQTLSAKQLDDLVAFLTQSS